MKANNIKRLIAVVLALSFVLILYGCTNAGNPDAMQAQTEWVDPTPEIRGTIQDAMYENTWLNLKKVTSTNGAFLEEYNNISCQADPERSRWCELYEYDEEGNSLILTVEKMPQNETITDIAQACCERYQQSLKDTKEDIDITVRQENTLSDYTFLDYSCLMYKFSVVTCHQETELAQKSVWFLFWEKDGHLITMQITNTYDILSELLVVFSTCTEVTTPSASDQEKDSVTEGDTLESVLKPPCAWAMSHYVEGRGTYTAEYAFLADGTCYMVMGLDVWLVGVSSGSYEVVGDVITITMDYWEKEPYTILYVVDVENGIATQTMKKGVMEWATVGTEFTFQPSKTFSVENIIDKATADWSEDY